MCKLFVCVLLCATVAVLAQFEPQTFAYSWGRNPLIKDFLERDDASNQRQDPLVWVIRDKVIFKTFNWTSYNSVILIGHNATIVGRNHILPQNFLASNITFHNSADDYQRAFANERVWEYALLDCSFIGLDGGLHSFDLGVRTKP